MRIKKFDIKSIKSDDLVVMIGKRKKGKSTLIKDIMYHHRDIPIGNVITHNDNNYGNDIDFYREFIPYTLIHEEGYKSEIVENMITHQKNKYPYNMDYGLIEGMDETIDRRVFCIIEDHIPEKEFKISGALGKVTKVMRRYQIFSIIALQYPVKMCPFFRNCIDYLFIFPNSVESNLERIHDNFGMFPTFGLFLEAMGLLGENDCLVYHLGSRSNKIEDMVFWYCAEIHEDFRLCREEVWQLDEKYREE